jgi:hypothetical protein
MTNDRPPPLLPPLTVKTAFDYLLIAASIAVAIAVVYIRVLG